MLQAAIKICRGDPIDLWLDMNADQMMSTEEIQIRTHLVTVSPVGLWQKALVGMRWLKHRVCKSQGV